MKIATDQYNFMCYIVGSYNYWMPPSPEEMYFQMGSNIGLVFTYL